MTKAPSATATPLRRLVYANGEEVVIELTETMLTVRPKRARKPLVEVTWGQVILRALAAPTPRATGRRRVSRGLL